MLLQGVLFKAFLSFAWIFGNSGDFSHSTEGPSPATLIQLTLLVCGTGTLAGAPVKTHKGCTTAEEGGFSRAKNQR
jgi:hypothetical protein